MRRLLRFSPSFFLAFAVLTAALQAHGQATEAEVSGRLMGKPLYLRGFWAEDKLRFDASGQPQKDYKTTSFTLAGFDPSSVKVDGDVLRLTGDRVALSFDDPATPKRGTLRVSSNKKAKPEKITIEVARGSDGTFRQPLSVIFADGLAELAPLLPAIWQGYAQAHFLPQDAPTTGGDSVPYDPKRFAAKTDASSKVNHIGGDLEPPQVAYSVAPQFTDIARRQMVSGNVQVYLWVGEDGVPTHLRIIRPVGMGLDEAAIAAVSQYRFKPATLKGKPVKVDLYINVNFQIF